MASIAVAAVAEEASVDFDFRTFAKQQLRRSVASIGRVPATNFANSSAAITTGRIHLTDQEMGFIR